MLGWMAASGALGAAAQVGGLRQAAAAPAARVVTRQEVRTLTPQQWKAFSAAVHALNRRTGNAESASRYDQFTSTHYANATVSHGVPAFFPWNREHLRRFEAALRETDQSVTLPYWDWARDSQSPERSLVFTPDYFGGNGTGADHIVQDGPFANWQVTVPKTHRLRRQYNAGGMISAFYSPEAIESIMVRSTTYDSFRRSIEGAPNGNVHIGIGGDNGDMSYMYSPNDPLHWVHRCFIDLLWAEWQARNPSLAATYNGSTGSRTVSHQDNLVPFNVTVASTLDTTRLGYNYPRWSANAATR